MTELVGEREPRGSTEVDLVAVVDVVVIPMIKKEVILMASPPAWS